MSLQYSVTQPAFPISLGTSSIAEDMKKNFDNIVEQIRHSPLYDKKLTPLNSKIYQTIEEQIDSSLSKLKKMTNYVAMHIGKEWRDKLFVQLDSLLDYDEWDEENSLPDYNSFNTFLRFMLNQRPNPRPSIGLFDGVFIASWVAGKDMLTVECLPNDEVRWGVIYYLEGKPYTASGTTTIAELPRIRFPDNFNKWFVNEKI